MTTSPELVVLVDDHDHPIGVAPKASVHTDRTPLHRAFSVFLFDRAGRLLTQCRAAHKTTWLGVWANSCCGHPLPDESRESAIRRRLRDELGVTQVARLTELLPQFRYRAELNGIVENELCPVWVGILDQSPAPNPDEVETVRWVDWDTFAVTCQAQPDAYAPWTIEETAALCAVPAFAAFRASLRGLERYNAP